MAVAPFGRTADEVGLARIGAECCGRFGRVLPCCWLAPSAVESGFDPGESRERFPFLESGRVRIRRPTQLLPRRRSPRRSRPRDSRLTFPLRCASAGSHDDGLGNLFLGHSLPPDFTLFADLPQAVFAWDAGDRGDKRRPSFRSFNFVEAQDHARAKSGFDRADMAFDLLSRVDASGRRLSPEVRPIAHENDRRPSQPGIELIRKLDQKDSALRHNIPGCRRRVLRKHRHTEQCGEKDSSGQTESTIGHIGIGDLPGL